MHPRAQDAFQACSGFVWKDPWVPVRIKTSTIDPCDSRRHCGFSRSHAMVSLNDNRHCEDGALSSAHGNILAEETVPAAAKLHADRLLVQPLEGPLTVPPFATSSVCSWFTVTAGHRSTGAPNSVMTWCCAWLRRRVVCRRCRASRWRMAVQLLAPCTFPGRFISRMHRHPHRRAPVGPCCRV
ncbi:surface protease GP63 [Trypanosoma cruzi]|nr:surface protease GP63 [Trypanosoma cruzi]